MSINHCLCLNQPLYNSSLVWQSDIIDKQVKNGSDDLLPPVPKIFNQRESAQSADFKLVYYPLPDFFTVWPSRRATSMIALELSFSHCFSPQGIGSIRLSVLAAIRHNLFTKSRDTTPSNSGETTSKSISLISSAPPQAYEPNMTPKLMLIPDLDTAFRYLAAIFTTGSLTILKPLRSFLYISQAEHMPDRRVSACSL
ncbi:hypothetical protein SMSP2_02850 [Limihaloglobus sulfuriphilus]|uniref:Uncharacterized protein n=1 Tax=Limihaloglobus sulfuriphilus TaxID=1851148 RepID=A0A1Q2MIC8_9BACT|nr:hypothetical protein SMSP2_02850 [Limihaloglobus sulfuriphilus]